MLQLLYHKALDRTPPQSFALIVDTGSTVTYVPCSTCEQCGRHQVIVFPSMLKY